MERVCGITLGGQQLAAIVHQPESAAEVGVVLIVGGPQYRVGSHRQFVQLSRALAREGIASLRFDYRGMGDSEGEKQPFDDICADIRAACDSFCAETGIGRIVLWGLCDAASAAMIYASTDSRVEGLVLLNPWLHSDAAMGKTMVRHYYLKRLCSADFWRKLLGGRVRVKAGLRDAKGFLHNSMAQSGEDKPGYQARMQAGIEQFRGKICLILSGVDLTAREFEQQALGSGGWAAFDRADCQLHRLPQADHTFSNTDFKRQVESISARFVQTTADTCAVASGDPAYS